MTELHMVRMVLQRRQALRVATAHRIAHDEGALLHAALAQVFATSSAHAHVPMQPFAIDDAMTEQACNPEAIYLLGYSPLSEGELIARMGPVAKELVVRLVTRRVDALPAGTEVGFRTRICPTVRTKHPGEHGVRLAKNGKTKGREVDAWLADRFADWKEVPPSQWEEPFDVFEDRERVYSSWLARELGAIRTTSITAPPAELVGPAKLSEFRRDGVLRDDPKVAPKPGRRGPERPNAVLEGTLRVTDAAAFQALLARGVGRHRAFGFGMLLLRRV